MRIEVMVAFPGDVIRGQYNVAAFYLPVNGSLAAVSRRSLTLSAIACDGAAPHRGLIGMQFSELEPLTEDAKSENETHS
jgi:hypothetical protein